MKVLLVIFLALSAKVSCDDFPSLLTANASIAIILDREYLDTTYEDTLAAIKVIIERVLREDLKNGGLIVTYYSWTKINLKKDFTAVFSITNCENTWNIYKESRMESLLILALTDPDCPRLPYSEAVMIPIMTLGEELPQVILDIKAQHVMSWTSSIILYDNTFDRDMISRCIIAISRNFPAGDSVDVVRPLSVSTYRIKESAHEWDRRKQIRSLLKSLPTKFIGKNFLVLVNSALMQNIMEVARDLKMVDTASQWFYIVSDTNYLNHNISEISSSLIEEGNNVAFIYNYTRGGGEECMTGLKCHSNELLRSFVLGLSKAIREEAAVYGQISDEEWEIVRPSKKERRDGILEYILADLRKTAKCSNCTTWNLNTAEIWGNRYDVATFLDESLQQVNDRGGGRKKVFKLIDAGVWKPFDGLKMTDVLFPHISHGFRGKTFHIITYHNPPWQYVYSNGSNLVGNAAGVIIDILNEMSTKLNFTFILHLAQVSTNLNTTDELNATMTKEIHLLTTDIPSDVLNLLTDDRIILGAVASTINERYKRMINFSIPISIQPYSFIVSKPKEISRIYLFTAPFSTGTWLCLAGLIVILPPILCLVNRLSPFYEFNGRARKLGLFKFDNCFWYIYGALLQQGGLYLPYADSGRIIIGSWWLIVIVLVTTYCGNLVAFLTFPKIDIQIQTIQQLVNHGSIKWGMRGGTYLEEYIKDTDSEKYQKLYEAADFYSDENDKIIDEVRKGKNVYIDWRSNLLYIMRREYLKTDTCDFALSYEEFMEEQIGMVLPKNSPYLNLFNAEITRLHQMGLIQRWIKEYMPPKDRCSKQSTVIEVINHTVNMDDMQGCFLVLLLGFGSGFFFFFCECILRYYRKYSDREVIKPFVE